MGANVGLYLGVPFVAGAVTRFILRPKLGAARYDGDFVPRVAPVTLGALLLTIVAMFSLQGARIIAHPLDVFVIALPLVVYFKMCIRDSHDEEWVSRSMKIAPYSSFLCWRARKRD